MKLDYNTIRANRATPAHHAVDGRAGDAVSVKAEVWISNRTMCL